MSKRSMSTTPGGRRELLLSIWLAAKFALTEVSGLELCRIWDGLDVSGDGVTWLKVALLSVCG